MCIKLNKNTIQVILTPKICYYLPASIANGSITPCASLLLAQDKGDKCTVYSVTACML